MPSLSSILRRLKCQGCYGVCEIVEFDRIFDAAELGRLEHRSESIEPAAVGAPTKTARRADLETEAPDLACLFNSG